MEKSKDRENQLWAYTSNGEIDIPQKTKVPEFRLFGITFRAAYEKSEKKWVHLDSRKGDKVPDDARLDRAFSITCKLIKAINGISSSDSRIMLYLDGYPNSTLSFDSTEINFDESVQDGPLVDMHFHGFCTRWGPIEHLKNYYAILRFKDADQMIRHFTVVNLSPTPKTGSRGGVSPAAAAPDNDCGIIPLVAGVAIGVALS